MFLHFASSSNYFAQLNFAVDFILEGKYYESMNNLCTGWEVFADKKEPPSK
jgi:hypothetical protein